MRAFTFYFWLIDIDVAVGRRITSDCCRTSVPAVQLRLEVQRSPVDDEVSAITAVVRPILEGLYYGMKEEIVATVAGGRAAMPLMTMARL